MPGPDTPTSACDWRSPPPRPPDGSLRKSWIRTRIWPAGKSEKLDRSAIRFLSHFAVQSNASYREDAKGAEKYKKASDGFKIVPRLLRASRFAVILISDY